MIGTFNMLKVLRINMLFFGFGEVVAVVVVALVVLKLVVVVVGQV